MPYTRTGIWHPLEWFRDMGVDVPPNHREVVREPLSIFPPDPSDIANVTLNVVERCYDDPSDESIEEGWRLYYQREQQRIAEQMEAEARARAEAAAREAAAQAERESRLQTIIAEFAAALREPATLGTLESIAYNYISRNNLDVVPTVEDVYAGNMTQQAAIRAALPPQPRPDFTFTTTEAYATHQRIIGAFAETLFDVTSEPVYRSGITDAVPGYQQIINCTTNEVLHIASDQYEIMQDRDVAARYAELFTNANIAIVPHCHHITRSKDGVMGRTTYMEFEIPTYNLTATINDTQVPMQVRLCINNSFDGTKKNRMTRLIHVPSLNMWTAGWQQDYSLAIRHRTGAMERLNNELRTFLTTANTTDVNIMQHLAAVNATQESINQYLASNPLLAGDRNSERLMGEWMRRGADTSLWTLYLVFVAVINETYGHNFGTKLQKLEQLNYQVCRNWAQALGLRVTQVNPATNRPYRGIIDHLMPVVNYREQEEE